MNKCVYIERGRPFNVDIAGMPVSNVQSIDTNA